MRSETEQVRVAAVTNAITACVLCGQAMEEAGRMDVWLFFRCRRCELVWRLRLREYLERHGPEYQVF